ncbi:MAG: cytochrome c [Myxococcota bacterium]
MMIGLGLAVTVVGCGDDRATAIADLTGDAEAGGVLYAQNCATCHADDGSGGSGPALGGEDDAVEMADVILSGSEEMPAFDTLSDQEIADIIAWVQAL